MNNNDEQPQLISSNSAGALLNRLRPQNDNIVKAMNYSTSATALNTLRAKGAPITSSAPNLQRSENTQSKIARLKAESGLNNISKSISNSLPALQLSTDPEIRAQLSAMNLHPPAAVIEDTNSNQLTSQSRLKGGASASFQDHNNSSSMMNINNKTSPTEIVVEEKISVVKNSFIASLNLTQQQLHELYKVPHTFFYLRQKIDGSSVYDLELVSLDKMDKDYYFTLSKEGVTQFRSKVSTFTSLSQWEREFRLFYRLSSISFFRIYRHWKVIIYNKIAIFTSFFF
jgi:hypothetical protein